MCSQYLRRGRMTAVDGWCSVEELARWGFAHAPVVMANEAHNGLRRCIRTRDVGVRIIGAAHQAGVRRLAMEALPRPADGTSGPIRAIPPLPGGYLAQPDMRRLITAALELGWTLWAYEADIQPGTDRAKLLTQEFTNWREREQAQNLCQILHRTPPIHRCHPPLVVDTRNTPIFQPYRRLVTAADPSLVRSADVFQNLRDLRRKDV